MNGCFETKPNTYYPLRIGSRLNCWHWSLLGLLSLILSFAWTGQAHGQASSTSTRRFPPDEYYASMSMLRDGRLSEAQHGFETAYRASREVREEHGIDSVPILIRIGQTLSMQGDIAEGLKNVEAGLLLSKRCRSWPRFIHSQPLQIKSLSTEHRGMQWYDSQRNTDIGTFPDSWIVGIGSKTLLVETVISEAKAAGDSIRLDAIEVYLAQAFGLRMRYQLLGSMAPELSTSRDILEAFPALNADLPEVLLRCHNICRGMALIAMGDEKAATQIIQSNLEVHGGWDHPLTGVGLLALADLANRVDDRPTAIRVLSESTIVFARLGQHDWLAETVQALAATSCLRRQSGALETLTELANWLRTRSYLSHTATLASAASLAVELENYPLAESNAMQALRKTSKTVGPIPQFDATAHFAIARAMIKQGKSDTGRTALEIPVRLGQGFDLPGPLSRTLFQIKWLEVLLDAGQVAPSAAIQVYDRLLDGPSKNAWLYQPWESLAAISADLSDSGIRWLGLVAAQADKEKTIEAFDRLHRAQCRYHLPLGGRELDIRLLFHSESPATDEHASELTLLRKQFPSMDQAANRIQRQIEVARKVKSIDAKTWSADEKLIWSQLYQQCDLQEQRLLDASTARTSIPKIFPPSTLIAEVKNQLKSNNDTEDRAFLGFFVGSKSAYGYLITPDRVELWIIDRIDLAFEKHAELLDAIGVGQSPSKVLGSFKNPAWPLLAKELQEFLIPENISKQISSLGSLTIIPHQWLWFVPFETFSDRLTNRSQVWLTQHAIHYAPTLGLAIQSLAASKRPTRTLGVTKSGFFVSDKEIDNAFSKGMIESVEGTQHVEIPSKVHGGRWSRLQFDQVWVAANVSIEYGTPMSLMAYDAGGATSLRQWLQLPLATPTVLVLAGSEVPAIGKKEKEGVELFRLACCLQASGNRATIVNRWGPRGESSQLLLKSFLEQSNELSASQAWRRSVMLLWETPLQFANEPILGPLKKDSFQEFSGKHPLFWSGTMVLGDTHP